MCEEHPDMCEEHPVICEEHPVTWNNFEVPFLAYTALCRIHNFFMEQFDQVLTYSF